MVQGAVARALGTIPFLRGLADAERAKIADKAEIRTYPEGTPIVAQDDVGRTLYVILAGRVRVVRHAEQVAAPVTEFGPGEFFGEMALLEDLPRSADVVALTPTTCALLGWDVFHRDLLGNPAVASGLLADLSRRLRALSALHERPHHATPASPQERERRILRAGETAMIGDIRTALVVKEHNHFTLFDPEGNIPVDNTVGLGLYLGDTRHLSGYAVSLGQVEPVVLVSTARLGYAAEQQLTNRDMMVGGALVRKETILIGRERLAHDAGFYEEIALSNFNTFPVAVDVQIRFAADFADIFEVRGVEREVRGTHLPADIAADTVTLRYDGRDGRRYETALTVDPPPTALTEAMVSLHLPVGALARATLRVRVAARVAPRPAGADGVASEGRHPEELPRAGAQIARAARSYQDWLATATRMGTDSELFDAITARSLSDLRLLVNRLDDQWYFAAGIPWFATLFGRDSLITGLQTLAWNPDLAAGILRLLARYQGTRDDAWRDEEPGKILHELRTGELARTGAIPHTPYYGSIDATPLFLVLAAEYHDWTGDTATLRALLPNIAAALDWCQRYGERGGAGYVAYARRSSKGLANQGWKDSGEGIMFKDGRLPEPPIALVEVQGYLYAAYRGIARTLRALDPVAHEARARDLDARAAALKARFNRDFWMPDAGFYALGLDGAGRRIDAVTSNPGQALWTGIIDEAKAPTVVARLLGDELFSGWGIRTLGRDMAAYNPLGYHLGTIWPHDNALIAAGMARYGFAREANRVLTALHEAALQFPYYRLPELFCGIERSAYGAPIGYPVACSPQAWAAGALPFVLGRTLGLRPADGGRTLHIVRPVLPPWLNEVRVRGLRVGGAHLDLTFTRPAVGPARVTIDANSGGVEVLIVDTLPVEA